MRRLLIFVCLALAAQALPLASETATLLPEVTTAHPSLSADQISHHMLMGWSLPQPGTGSRPTREAAVPSDAPQTVPSSFSANLVKKHTLMDRALPQPGPGPRPTHEAPAISTEATTTHPFLSSEQISQHMLMGFSLPQPGPGPRPTREADVPLNAPQKPPSSFSDDLGAKHTLMGWPLPQTSPSLLSTSDAPAEPTTTPKLSLFSSEPESGLPGAKDPPRNVPQTISGFSLSPAQIVGHTRMGWALPMPGAKQRTIRAVPRALPAHKAHGPRSPFPMLTGPQKTKLRATIN